MSLENSLATLTHGGNYFLTNSSFSSDFSTHFPILSSVGAEVEIARIKAESFSKALMEEMFWLSGNIQEVRHLTDLLKIMREPMTHEVYLQIKRAMHKRESYLKRFFLKETWLEWAEDRTALGRVIALFVEYMESPFILEVFMKRLDRDLLKKANEEAFRLIANIQTDVLGEESFGFEVFQETQLMLARVDRFITSLLPLPPMVAAQDEHDDFAKFSAQQLEETTKSAEEALRERKRREELESNKPTIVSGDLSFPQKVNNGQSASSSSSAVSVSTDRDMEAMLRYGLGKPTNGCLLAQDFENIKTGFCNPAVDAENFSESCKIVASAMRLPKSQTIKYCFTDILNLVSTFKLTSEVDCSPEMLHSLPGLLSSILSRGSVLKFSDIDILVKEMYEVIKKWIPHLEGLEKETLAQFCELFLLIAEKRPNDQDIVVSMLRTGKTFAKSNPDFFSSLRVQFRKLARRYSEEPEGSEKQIEAAALLSALSSKAPWPAHYIFNWLDLAYDGLEDFWKNSPWFSKTSLVIVLAIVSVILLRRCLSRNQAPENNLDKLQQGAGVIADAVQAEDQQPRNNIIAVLPSDDEDSQAGSGEDSDESQDSMVSASRSGRASGSSAFSVASSSTVVASEAAHLRQRAPTGDR